MADPCPFPFVQSVMEQKKPAITSTLRHGAHTSIGSRRAQEDAWMKAEFTGGDDTTYTCFTVLDGHGGRGAVDFVRATLHTYLQEEVQKGLVLSAALDAAYRRVDLAFRAAWRTSAPAVAVTAAAAAAATSSPPSGAPTEERQQQPPPDRPAVLHGASSRSVAHAGEHSYPTSPGTTAVTLVVERRGAAAKWHVAWVGDSRCYIVDAKGAVEQTRDHRPDDAVESRRIEGVGGHVEAKRVNGYLAMSRAIGDLHYKRKDIADDAKQMVTCVPSYLSGTVAGESVMVLATDGLYDLPGTPVEAALSGKRCDGIAVEVRAAIAKTKEWNSDGILGALAIRLVEDAGARGSGDNATAVVVGITSCAA